MTQAIARAGLLGKAYAFEWPIRAILVIKMAMQSVSCESMRDLENTVFAIGHTPEALMQQAGERMAQSILRYFPHYSRATAYLGKGHNAGDALVIARHLQYAGWELQLRCPYSLNELSPLTLKMFQALHGVSLDSSAPAPAGSLLIDGMLGIGASGPIRPPLADIALEINETRDSMDCIVVALDSPSGVNADTGEIYSGAVRADHTLSVGYPKSGLLHSMSTSHVGAISQVVLDAFEEHPLETASAAYQLITPHTLSRRRRDFDTHKGQAGRVGIWAGSEGMLGAAVLTATAALKSGAGLITMFTPPALYPTLAPMLPPEIMVQSSITPLSMLERNFDALVLGPGIGNPPSDLANQLIELVEKSGVPTVLDADILNLIAREQKHSVLHSKCILTPHPGEMKRLHLSSGSREETAQDFCNLHSITLLLKGARTIITAPGSPLFINSSGSPAMATAGQGDVLSGLIGGLCAQGYSQIEACNLGAWLAGEAAQLAIASQAETEETLTASSVIEFLHQAFLAVPRQA
ncbi:MAG: NAD(P)H-hydrate dehydratase [Rubritalea sp.]|uniref:NAD(P)H-hydrate dehydratase n=1 Tax=Rubritalea sp. TaxID=2109375 RepID=UPI0032422D49